MKITNLYLKFKNQVSLASRRAGFTMIELLIVISILGILAVAVLSAINPIEQINRGRDTGTRSDAEQLVSAIDRLYAFSGVYPWQLISSDPANFPEPVGGGLQQVTATLASGVVGIDPILTILSTNSDELKHSFVTRIDTMPNPLHIFNQGTTGSSTYVCFIPQSKAFREEAELRCVDAAGSGMPADTAEIAATVCGGYGAPATDVYVCLP